MQARCAEAIRAAPPRRMQEATAKRLCDRLHYSFGCGYAAAVKISSLSGQGRTQDQERHTPIG